MLIQDPEKNAPRKASFGATMKAVLWAFFGVRKKSDYEKDAQLNPVHVIIIAIIGAVIFIAALVIIVRIVVAP